MMLDEQDIIADTAAIEKAEFIAELESEEEELEALMGERE